MSRVHGLPGHVPFEELERDSICMRSPGDLLAAAYLAPECESIIEIGVQANAVQCVPLAHVTYGVRFRSSGEVRLIEQIASPYPVVLA